jgi:transcriptional regulator with XRE-family HTH domain
MDWKFDLGRQLREARKSVGLTQGQLAVRLNISRQMVCRYEAGSAAPAFDVLASAVTILGAEFQVLGLQITSRETSGRPTLQSMPKQLSLQFNKSRSFEHAVVKITPHRGRILITADIPA